MANIEFKTAGRSAVSVGKQCSLINGQVRLMDNGNGQRIWAGNAADAVNGEYAACEVGTVKTAFGDVVIWIPRK